MTRALAILAILCGSCSFETPNGKQACADWSQAILDAYDACLLPKQILEAIHQADAAELSKICDSIIYMPNPQAVYDDCIPAVRAAGCDKPIPHCRAIEESVTH